MDSGRRSAWGLEASPSLIAVTLSPAQVVTWLSLTIECWDDDENTMEIRKKSRKSTAIQSTQTSGHYSSLLLFVYDMFRSFIRPSSGGRYKYVKEKCAVERALPWQSTWYNTLNILLQHTSSIFTCILFLTMVEWTTETCRREIIMKDIQSSDGMLCGLDCCRLPVTTGCCCLNSRKMWKVSICEASFSGHNTVIHYRCLPFLFMLTNKFVLCRRTRAAKTAYFIVCMFEARRIR